MRRRETGVEPGELLARLDTSRLEPMSPRPKRRLAAQHEVSQAVCHGSRPEEIAQARANVDVGQGRCRQRPPTADRTQEARHRPAQRSATVKAVSQEDIRQFRGRSWPWPRRSSPSARRRWIWPCSARARRKSAEAEASWAPTRPNWRLLKQYLADANLLAPVECRGPHASDGAGRNGLAVKSRSFRWRLSIRSGCGPTSVSPILG